MPVTEESLFSLELVVDKLYIPHIQCRFPAVAFRLLDFPTIVINHVETDLGKTIRRQISFDPDYEIPNQFSELKDKHGNFMVQKGKSCLFKMIANTLKNHLANTPLYVMVIDMFPETPKLVGNSTVPLNILIDAICADLVRVGTSVPSVHGDKGLFKVYNLMGKEIGYFVLGFRLLCLGPSLIPHLPQAALVQRQTKKQVQQQKQENKQFVEMVQLNSQDESMQVADEEENMVETRTWGSMTDPVKNDVMMQTVEMDHKGVHVDFQNPTAQTENVVVDAMNYQPLTYHQRNAQHFGTQTDKKGVKTAFNVKKKVLEDLAAMEKDEDEVIITNIVCPPPLFFNSAAKPYIEVENDSYSLDTEMSVSDDASFESFTEEEADIKPSVGKTNVQPKESVFIDKGQIIAPPAPISYQNVPLNVRFNAPQNESPKRSRSAGNLPVQISEAGFPLLTALMNELISIQNPNMLHLQQLQGIGINLGISSSVSPRDQRTPAERLFVKPLTSKQAAFKTDEVHHQKETDEINQIINIGSVEKETVDEKDVFVCHRFGHHKCVHPHAGVPKDKSWLRVIPHSEAKKSKLVFGMTNTQRLRLQKTNPQWLKNMEHAELMGKGGKGEVFHKHDSGDELNVSISDTLTEVRLLARKELEKPTADDTQASNLHSTMSANTSKRARSNTRAKGNTFRKRSRSTSKRQTTPQNPQSPNNPNTDRSRQRSDKSIRNRSKLYPFDANVKNPGLQPFAAGEPEDDVEKSAGSLDLPSSAHSRSIEVRIPSVQATHDEASEISVSDSEDDVPLPDESYNKNRNNQHINFPTYLKQSQSLPESIHGQSNQSLNTTDLDDDSPLESTRNCHKVTMDSKNMSTGDADTKQTFQSTSEPELQDLNESLDDEIPSEIVERKKVPMKFPVVNPLVSENSPVPSTRRSVALLDLSRSQIPATPYADSVTPRSSRSGSPKRPTPRPRPHHPPAKDLHTESISSYQPTDSENPLGSFDSSGEGNYSDDFAEELANLRTEKQRAIPFSKLGYTIY